MHISAINLKLFKEEAEEREDGEILKLRSPLDFSGNMSSKNLKTLDIAEMTKIPAEIKMILITRPLLIYVVVCRVCMVGKVFGEWCLEFFACAF